MLIACACYSGNRVDASGADDEGATEGASSEDGSGDDGPPRACAGEDDVFDGRAPLRRLTKFEYNNTVRDLLGDDTLPGNAFPSEEIGNGFGNDAEAQAVSSLLAEQYGAVAEEIAGRATATPSDLAQLAPCAGDVTASTDRGTEDACAFDLIEGLTRRAYRRPLVDGEADELFELQQTIRENEDFDVSIAAFIETLLQSPDFLYRIEWGVVDPQGRRRPSGYEMASRLSYFLWGTMPDEDLFAAAESGELLTNEGVQAHAERMIDHARARPVVRFFFDNLLPISDLSALERDDALYPTFTATIGAYMREETQTFLEHVIFERGGTWTDVLTADYTFMNGPLAEYYGVAGVQGEEFVRVDLDTSQRLGLLTQAGMVAGTIHSNETNPVVRGAFVVGKMMCLEIPLPTGDLLEEVRPPDPDSGATARERYSQHSEDPACAGCHQLMDPVGFALENYDPVGLWRDTENGVTIDASGNVPGIDGTVDGPIELVQTIATAEATYACFAGHWANFALGRTLDPAGEDECVVEQIEEAFTESGYNVRALLLSVTQSDAFLYLPEGGS